LLLLTTFLQCQPPIIDCTSDLECRVGSTCQDGRCRPSSTEPTHQPDAHTADTAATEPGPEPKAEPAPEPKSDSTPEPTSETTSEPKPEPKPELVPESRPERVTEPQKEPVPEQTGELSVEKEPVPDSKPTSQLPTWQDDPCQALASDKPGFGSLIARWQSQDAKSLAKPGGLVVVGSSSVRLWKTLQKEFSAWNITQRGFGGARLIDVALEAKRLVIPHKPRAVLVFAGTNDIAAGVAQTKVFDAFRCLLQAIKTDLGSIPVGFIGITPTPSRWANWSKADQLNKAVQVLASQWSGVHYIDIPTTFLKTGRPPSSSLFVSDRLHLSVVGYTLWNTIIKQALPAMAPQQTPVTPTPQPKKGSQVLVDFGPDDKTNGNATLSPDSNGQHWNSWHKTTGGSAITPGEALALKAADGTMTPWRLLISGQWVCNGIQNGGLLSPVANLLGKLGINTATQDFFYVAQGTQSAGMTLTGLDPQATYRLRVFASRSTTEARTSRYEVTGASTTSQSLQTSGKGISADGKSNGNDSAIATFTRLAPDAYGKLHLDVVVEKGSFGYISLLALEVE
jgi:lysophospholipase L1-like esterase